KGAKPAAGSSKNAAEGSSRNAAEGSSTPTAEESAAPVPGSTLLMAGGSCADFIWFSEDAMMEFTYHDAGNKLINRTKMTVTEVKTTDEGTIALVNSSDDSGHSFDLNMVCSNGNLYMD